MHIKIRVITGAPKEVIRKIDDEHIEMYIKEPPERNLANKRVLEVMRSLYPDVSIRMVSGHHLPSKIVVIGRDA